VITGRRRPYWGKPESRPWWWPGDIDFADVNNSGSRPRLEQLVTILEAFKNREEADDVEQEMMEDDRDEPESPEVPVIIVQTSSTHSPAQTSSTPAQTSSGSTLAQFTSTPAPSASSRSAAQLPVSPIPSGVPAGILDSVRRNFGDRSNYLSNRWKEVFDACSHLNSMQTSKLLRILGDLNEEVSVCCCFHDLHSFFIVL